MEMSVLQSKKTEKTTHAGSMNQKQISLYIFFGVVLPVSALVVNYHLFGGGMFDMLYTTGAVFMLPRPAYVYITISSGIATLFLWMVVFRNYGKRYNGFIAGILLFNGFFFGAFGIAAIYRFFIFPVWVPPFCAATVLLSGGIRAWSIAQSVMRKRLVVISALVGMVLYARLVHGINMQKANLQDADLHHACLDGVNLIQVNLLGVNLNNAQICQVDFTGANLQGASLGFHKVGRVFMKETNLCGADLREMKSCEGVYNWTGAVYNSATLWPKDFDPTKMGMILVEDKAR